MKYLLCLEAHPAKIVKISIEDGKKETILEISNGIPDGIWVDRHTRKIYWSVMGQITNPPEGFLAKDGSIECCDLDGRNHVRLLGNGSVTTPKQIIGNEETHRLYWCDREGMALMSCLTDGSDFKILMQYTINEPDSNIAEKYCVGIAMDLKKEYLYWTQKGPLKGGKGKIFRTKLSQQYSIDNTNIELLLDHLPEPIDLEFGTKTGKLYWTDRGAGPSGNSLNCAVVDESGKLINHEIIARGFQEAIGLAVDEEEDVVYVSDLGGYIKKISLTDGSITTVLKQGPTTGITILE